MLPEIWRWKDLRFVIVEGRHSFFLKMFFFSNLPVQLIANTGSPLPEIVASRIRETLNVAVTQGNHFGKEATFSSTPSAYSSAETGIVSFDDYKERNQQIVSSGYPFINIQLEVRFLRNAISVSFPDSRNWDWKRTSISRMGSSYAARESTILYVSIEKLRE